MKIIFVGLILCALWLAGCATMSKDECQQADWYLTGVEDAVQGFPLDRVIEHGKACSRINVVPDMKEYRVGHNKGARLYCVPEKGYSEGRNGAAYSGICAPELEERFLRAYNDGRELYLIQRNMDAIRTQITNNNAQVDRTYSEIAQLKRELVKSNNEADRRMKMRRINELENSIRNLELDSQRAVRELDLFNSDYYHLEDQHRRMGYLH